MTPKPRTIFAVVFAAAAFFTAAVLHNEGYSPQDWALAGVFLLVIGLLGYYLFEAIE